VLKARRLGALARNALARINNSCQIRIPTSRDAARIPRRRLLLTFGGRLLQFAYFNAEDANRVIGFHTKEPLTIRMLKLINPGDIVLDVGASMGIYSIPAAVAVGSTGRVIAIEADASKIARLSMNARLNRVADRIEIADSFAGEMSVPNLQQVSLDDLFLSHQYPEPTIIKIDVDGPEMQVIRGLRFMLQLNSRLRLVQIEFCESNHELIDYLGDFGFKMVAFETHESRDVALFEGTVARGNGWFARRGANS